MLDACPTIRDMRDPTRGGISGALNEMATASRGGVKIDEATIPMRPEIHAACEMLDFDALYVANEGKLLAVVPANAADLLLEVMRGALAIVTVRRVPMKTRFRIHPFFEESGPDQFKGVDIMRAVQL